MIVRLPFLIVRRTLTLQQRLFSTTTATVLTIGSSSDIRHTLGSVPHATTPSTRRDSSSRPPQGLGSFSKDHQYWRLCLLDGKWTANFWIDYCCSSPSPPPPRRACRNKGPGARYPKPANNGARRCCRMMRRARKRLRTGRGL